MKTRTILTIKTLLILSTIGASGCKQGTILNKTCSLNYEEEMQQHQDNLARGAAKEEDAPRPCNYPTPEPGANLGVNLVMRNFTTDQEKKMRDAVERIKIVINSTDFKERVLAHTYNGQKTFVENEGLSNEEIYEKIMDGAEVLNPVVDNMMDVDVTMYYKATSTVGYTYPDTNRTWVNSRFFNGYTAGQVSSNVVHEWTHKLGFGHSYYNNSSRPYTVPYGVGSIISELVDSM
jgi:hypothetical protein